jgi:hypothetical protein
MRALFILPLLILLIGCTSSDNPVKKQRVESLPSQFQLIGEAKGGDDSRDVACHLNFFFELREQTIRTDQLVEYKGFHGGEAVRTIQKKDGSGFVFNADSGGEVIVRLIPETGQIEIISPLNATAPTPFWHNLASLPGSVYVTGVGSGTWKCAPLDIEQGGYVDTDLIIDGQWRMEPIQ